VKNLQRQVLLGSGLCLALLISLCCLNDPATAWSNLPGRGARGPRVVQAPARASLALPWDDGGAGPAVVLKWDQLGPLTSGVGIGATLGVQAAQALMRFGGGSVTTNLMPLILPIAVSWSIFTCTNSPCPPRVPRNNRMNTQRVNLWNAVPIMNRLEPGVRIFNTVFRSPLDPPGSATNTVNTFVIKTFAGAPKFRPSEFFFAGIGASGPNQANQFWNFVAEGQDPDAQREWFGSGATMAHTIGPTTFGSQLAHYDFGIRVTVDQGVPPELDVSTGPSNQGASRVRTFVQTP